VFIVGPGAPGGVKSPAQVPLAKQKPAVTVHAIHLSVFISPFPFRC
jgi:hypothetical protein